MQELNKFKQEINIAEFAQLWGYRIDREKSSRAVKQLRNDETGDKIVVTRNQANGHYIYFSMKNDQDNGTIIDFIQKRTRKNLGEVRKICRSYIRGELEGVDRIQRIKVSKSEQDRVKIFKMWEEIKSINTFVDIKSIDADIWNNAITTGRVKIDRNFIYFPMFDLDGMCGISTYSMHTKDKRMVKGSTKGLWSMGNMKAKYVLFTESPIDALSYLELNPEIAENAFVVATMGTLSEGQKLSIREIARRLNEEQEVILATDSDEAGDKIAEEIVRTMKEANHRLTFYRHKSHYKDWHEELENKTFIKVYERTGNPHLKI